MSGLPMFTGQMRDGEPTAGTEMGLDYFGARYFWGVLGRFTSADGPFNDQEENDPQSWNLYGYVRNNPLVATDPTGMWELKPPEAPPKQPTDPWAPGGAAFDLWWHSFELAYVQNNPMTSIDPDGLDDYKIFITDPAGGGGNWAWAAASAVRVIEARGDSSAVLNQKSVTERFPKRDHVS